MLLPKEIFSQVPALKKLLPPLEHGHLKVRQAELPEGIQALYVSAAGANRLFPETQDTIFLSSLESDGLWERSLLVHEGDHALDDFEGPPPSIGHLRSEVRAWVGQAAYLDQQLQHRPEDWPGLHLRLEQLGNLERGALALALAQVPGAASGLPQYLQQSLEPRSGLEQLLQDPVSNLSGLLGLIYFSRPETQIPVDGLADRFSP